MSIARELADLFQDVVVCTPVTRDGMGKVVSRGTPRRLKARVRGGQSFTFVRDGKEVRATTTACFAGAYGLDLDYEYLLPSRYSPRAVDAVDVKTVTDDDGPDHDKAFFA